MTTLRSALVGCAFVGTLSGCGSDPTEPASNVDAPPAFVLDEGTLTLHPGQEGLFCKQMPVAAEHVDSYITGVDAEVSLGTHHLIMTFSDGDLATEPPLCKDTRSGQVTSGDASFQDFAVDPNPLSVVETIKRIVLGGGGGDAKIRFPKGYGKPMPRGFFESSHHVLNAGSEPLPIFGRFAVYAETPDRIEFPLGVLFGNAFTIQVAPHSDGFVESTVLVPEAFDIVAFMSHAHKQLTRFEIFVYSNGEAEPEPIYVSEDWETPLVQVQNPPVRLNAGDGLTFRCTYQNDTSAPLGWGVTDGEMCMPFALYAYPEGRSRDIPPTMSISTSDATPVLLKEGTSGFFGG